MKTGKITAKLRDAVPVCLMAAGKEVKRYKNIELPDLIKELEMTDFHFNIHADSKITFEIHYADGVLPTVFPVARAKMTRAEKAAMKAKEQAATLQDTETASTEPSKADSEAVAPAASEEAAVTSEETSDNIDGQGAESSSMEIAYNIIGPRRKELALAVGDFIGAAPKYMKAPTYAFAVADYTIDRNGTLIGAENKALVEALTEKGFIAA